MARRLSWSLTIRTPPPALRARSISTKANSATSRSNEVRSPHLEQHEAEEAPHRAHAAFHRGGLYPLRRDVLDQAGLDRRGEPYGFHSPDRATQGIHHSDSALQL